MISTNEFKTNVTVTIDGDAWQVVEFQHAEKEVKIIKGNALNIIETLCQRGEKFDIIFSDPPYDKGLNEKIYKKLLDNSILKPGGTLVLEHSASEDPTSYIDAAVNIRTEKYGDTGISLIIWK